ncbi:response regulator FixJ [Chelativorans alearense]|uniref:response regulator FixJ n=1 Tax=Chelativorans alearense TaxID=2681495 RepID=UPI0013D8820B|nr:response regulator FixJ [Chelativorans alearense]
MPDAVRIHIVDDDQAMRSSLVFLLGSASLEAEPHESAESFLAVLPSRNARCVVTDVRMPGMNGLDLVRRVQQIDKDLPVIVITGQSDVSLAIEALQAGAFDFIEKPFEDERIIAAVRSALDRRSDDWQKNKADAVARLEQLTERERQVLDGLAAGHANSVIADRLGISRRTVEVHRAKVMEKLHASTLSQIIRLTLVSRGGSGTG